jgi:hypothetical protein
VSRKKRIKVEKNRTYLRSRSAWVESLFRCSCMCLVSVFILSPLLLCATKVAIAPKAFPLLGVSCLHSQFRYCAWWLRVSFSALAQGFAPGMSPDLGSHLDLALWVWSCAVFGLRETFSVVGIGACVVCFVCLSFFLAVGAVVLLCRFFLLPVRVLVVS